MPHININTDASVVYAAKLERYSKTALPRAVRGTLNEAALDVKRVTMPAETNKDFKKRKPTFWSATSRVEFAGSGNIDSMRSIVGFVAPADVKESGHATKDLEQQEHGGSIDKRAYIATDAGRTGRGNVREALTMARIKSHIIDANTMRGKNSAEKFIKAALKVGYGANGIGGLVIGTGRNAKGSRAVMKIISIHRAKAGERAGVKAGNMIINSKEVYDVRGHRRAHVQATHFMEKASEESGKKMERFFIEQTQKLLS